MIKGFDYPGICVVYFCHDGKGKFIMALRNKNTRDEHDKWDIGAGGIEFGHSVEQTLKKEIKEEYCTNVLNYDFLGYRDVQRIHNGKKTHWISLDFAVQVDRDKVKIGEPEKFNDLKWYTLKNKPENIHSQLPNFFELYKEKLPK